MKLRVILMAYYAICFTLFSENLLANPLIYDNKNESYSPRSDWHYNYAGEGLNNRISNNTFSETATFIINNYPAERDDYEEPLSQTPQFIRPRAAAPDDEDTPPQGWNDPYPTPVGDIPIPLLLLFIIMMVLYTHLKHKAHTS